MHNIRLTSFFIALLCTPVAMAQPRSISNIVDQSSISNDDEQKIQKYAVGWAELLLAEDADTLEQARGKLVDPFEPNVRMTPYARNLYGKYLKEGFQPLLNQSNANEMAAVNALQVLALLGTEQACGVLLKHADVSTEPRPTLRLWSSVGIGTSFLTGELQDNRIERYAQLLSNFTNKETEWFVLARQFDSLAALQSIPGLDTNTQDEFEVLSFQLQAQSLTKLLQSINDAEGVDHRVQALPFVLPSLMLQLIEPSVDSTVRDETLNTIVPPLVDFVAYAANNSPGEEDTFVHGSYGGAAHAASLLISRSLGTDEDVQVIELWRDGDFGSILELVEVWKSKQ